MTHTELVKRAAKWLEKEHPVVVTEMGTQGCEEPDAIGFKKLGVSTLIECKTSRGDYYSDRKKGPRRMGDFKYFLTPRDLLKGLTLTEGWGLLEVRGRIIRVILHAPRVTDKNWQGEQALLLSCFRRLGKPRPESCVSVKTYVFGSANTATLGVDRKTYKKEKP